MVSNGLGRIWGNGGWVVLILRLVPQITGSPGIQLGASFYVAKEKEKADDTVTRILWDPVPFYIYKVAASKVGPR